MVSGLNEYTQYYWTAHAWTPYGYSYRATPVWRFTTGGVCGVEKREVNGIPGGFVLHQNQPNPYNPTTTLRFEIRESRFVNLRIYDILGREVGTLVNETMGPGSYAIPWDAGNRPAGVYFCRMEAGRFSQTRKLLLVR